jgi:hypothetical protein
MIHAVSRLNLPSYAKLHLIRGGDSEWMMEFSVDLPDGQSCS